VGDHSFTVKKRKKGGGIGGEGKKEGAEINRGRRVFAEAKSEEKREM